MLGTVIFTIHSLLLPRYLYIYPCLLCCLLSCLGSGTYIPLLAFLLAFTLASESLLKRILLIAVSGQYSECLPPPINIPACLLRIMLLNVSSNSKAYFRRLLRSPPDNTCRWFLKLLLPNASSGQYFRMLSPINTPDCILRTIFQNAYCGSNQCLLRRLLLLNADSDQSSGSSKCLLIHLNASSDDSFQNSSP